MWYLTVILLLGYVYRIETVSKVGGECAVAQREREDCGFRGVKESDCRERGCCWAPCHNCPRGIPWCFFSQDMMDEKCEVRSEDKVDCGHYGIKQDECVSRECCWKPSKRPNDPWCFNSKKTTTTPRPTTTTTTEPTTPEYGEEGMVRLVNGASAVQEDGFEELVPYSGRLEIYHDGQWGTVCDDEFNDYNARVVCSQVGWFGGGYHGDAHYGEGSGPIWMDQVSCEGQESSLSECNHQGWGSNDCSHSEDVSIHCDTEEENTTSTDTGVEGEIRLAGGSSENEGRVEIYHDGQWGTVCDDYFDGSEGDVVCRQLGYFPTTNDNGLFFGSGSGKIWLDDMNCAGHESRLADCGFSCWECQDCGHGEDVGVRCLGELQNFTTPAAPGSEDSEEGSIRLAEGTGDSDWSGRLEIFHNGRWGTFCDDSFTIESAQVACRELGFSGGRSEGNAYYGPGSENMPTWLDGVWCLGSEERLVSCEHQTWGEEDCSHDEDIGLICEPGIGGNFTAGYNETASDEFDQTTPSYWETTQDDQ